MNVLYLSDEKKLEEIKIGNKNITVLSKMLARRRAFTFVAFLKVVSPDFTVRQVTESNRVLRPLAVHSSRG